MPARSTGLGSSPCGIAGDRRHVRLFSLQARRANKLGESPGAAMGFTLKTVVREASGTVGVVIERWRLRPLTLDQAKREVDQGHWARDGIEPNGFEIVDDEGSVLARRSDTGPHTFELARVGRSHEGVIWTLSPKGSTLFEDGLADTRGALCC